MTGITRRRLLAYGAGAGTAVALPWPTGSWLAESRSASASTGSTLEKFVQALPVPGNGLVVAAPSGTNRYSFTQVPITKRLHPKLPPTPLFAYDDGSGLGGQLGSFGMVVVARSGTPLDVTYTNGN